MNLKYSALIAAMAAASASAFTTPSAMYRTSALKAGLADDDIESVIARSVSLTKQFDVGGKGDMHWHRKIVDGNACNIRGDNCESNVHHKRNTNDDFSHQ